MIALYNETDKRWFFTETKKKNRKGVPYKKSDTVNGVLHTSRDLHNSLFKVPVEQMDREFLRPGKLRRAVSDNKNHCYQISFAQTSSKVNLHNMQRIIRKPHDPQYAQNLLLVALDISNMSEIQYVYNGAQLQSYTETKNVLYAMVGFNGDQETFGIWFRDKTTGEKKYKVFIHKLDEKTGFYFIDTYTEEKKQTPKGILTSRLQPYLPRRPAYLMCVQNSERQAFETISRHVHDVIYFDDADDLYAKMKQIQVTNPMYNAVSLFTNTEYATHQKLNEYELQISKYVRILRSEMDYVSRWYKSAFTKQIQVKKVVK